MFTTPRLVVVALCAALNFSIGSIVYLVKLPIYLDSIGTILCALLLAPDRKAAFLCAWAAAWMSLVVSSFVNPFLPWFAATDIAIAAVTALVTIRAAACGILTGVAAAAASAPVVVYLFGGVTGSGSAFVVAFFLKTGQHLMSAALLSGLTADPVDKCVQVLIAALLYRATPAAFIALLRAPAPGAVAR
jgi:energy-coupling factor transport system substrate-specific component